MILKNTALFFYVYCSCICGNMILNGMINSYRVSFTLSRTKIFYCIAYIVLLFHGKLNVQR